MEGLLPGEAWDHIEQTRNWNDLVVSDREQRGPSFYRHGAFAQGCLSGRGLPHCWRVLDLDYERLCRDRIAWSGAQHRFIFAGTQDDITQVYCALDVVVVPSVVPEGFGLTALEGLMYGKPVVAYASGGLQEVLTVAGCPHLLADPGSTASLVEKVRSILDQPDQGVSLGMQNRMQAQAVYGPAMYQVRVNEMVSRWMNEHPEWFQATARTAKHRVAPTRRHKQRKRIRKKRGKAGLRRIIPRTRTRRTEGKPTRRRASKPRQRRTSARRRKA